MARAHGHDDARHEWSGIGVAGAGGAEPPAGAPHVGLPPGRARPAGAPPHSASIPAEALRARATRRAGSGTIGHGSGQAVQERLGGLGLAGRPASAALTQFAQVTDQRLDGTACRLSGRAGPEGALPTLDPLHHFGVSLVHGSAMCRVTLGPKAGLATFRPPLRMTLAPWVSTHARNHLRRA